jgi:hypothetical protein
MKGYGKFHYAKACGKMPAMHAYNINNVLPELIANLVKLLTAKALKISR